MSRRWPVNISRSERAGRVLVGLVGAISGMALLAGSPAAVVAVLATLLILAGLDLLVTGAVGHCPLYSKLGHVPRSIRRTS
jgi:uncharacterized membrane protein HdeD (DUF308 family)